MPEVDAAQVTDDAEGTDGTADQGAVDTSQDAATDAGEGSEGSDALGDAGKKALDSMKAKWKAAEDKANRTAIDARKVAAELQTFRDAEADRNRSEAEKVTEQNRRQAKADAEKTANERVVKLHIKVAAKGVLADPDDALAYLKLSSFTVDDEGDVNPDEVAAAIADLIKKKPYLAVAVEKKFPAGDAGNARKGQEGPSQLTKADMDKMSPQQIMAAQRAGQFDQLILKTQRG